MNSNVDILRRLVIRTQRSSSDVQLSFLNSNANIAALQTKCQKLAEPTILREITDRKIKEKEEER